MEQRFFEDTTAFEVDAKCEVGERQTQKFHDALRAKHTQTEAASLLVQLLEEAERRAVLDVKAR